MFGIDIILYKLLINHRLPSFICLLQLPISSVHLDFRSIFFFCFAYLFRVTRASILNEETLDLFIICGNWCFWDQAGVLFILIYCAVTFDLLPTTGSARLALPAGKPQNCHALPPCMCVFVYSPVQKLLKLSSVSTNWLHNHTACFSSKRI